MFMQVLKITKNYSYEQQVALACSYMIFIDVS